MSDGADRVRILVVLPDAFDSDPSSPPGQDAHGTAAALRRLGEAAVLLRAESLADAAARVDACDLVVLDGEPPSAAGAVLAAAGAADVPAIAVVERADDPQAVEWFRRGASDCVTAGGAGGAALAAVALEQIRRGREVRERSAVERRLAWLEQLHAAIVTEIPAALAVLDAERRVVMTNPAFDRAFGGGGAVPMGRPLDAVLPRDLLESGGVHALLARAARGEPAGPAIARGGGPEAPMAFDVRAERLDDEGRLLLVLADVTEREALARQVADLQRYTENIIQTLNSALLVVDTDGVVTFANGTAAQILGEPRGSLRGRSVWDWFSSARVQDALLARSLAGGERFRGAETMLTRADGTLVPIGISCAPLRDADGTPLGAVAIFQDLTEITLLQRQVLQTEKMASIGQLAAGVAHEINNPMGFIHANLFQMAEYLDDLRDLWNHVGGLRKAADGGDLAEVRRGAAALATRARELDVDFVLSDFAKAIRESQEGSERIRHIVRDLRDFSRQSDDESVPADVNQCLDSTANIVWSMMKHSVVLRKRYADLPRVRCNPMQLKQVFMNLLVNAYQAIEERVGDSGERGEIELVTEREGASVVVRVSDTGAGIPPEMLGRIFDPFFTTKEVGVGVGLGLSTSFSIVQKHGGSLRACNRDGVGATFEVVLPLEAGTDGAPA